ncbi:FtsW/RodA/SpoVE family cell cycle protein [Lacrimispora saccharolytica]|nr:rod shape-determining protein RodA [Lachnospiraceae bacterium]MDM8247904.1 FtsW/RodA/SpoVE family cell cycle protein [Lacrimispora saccharolytica]
MLKRYKLKNYNFLLVILLITISTIGVLLIGSAAREYQSRQLIGVITGLILMVVISLIDYSWILNFSWILYVLNLVLLIILKTGFGEENLGATRWLNIGGFQFQPTEIAKIILIIFFAMFLMKHEDDLNTAKTIFKAIGLLLLPLVLVLTQPDLKNTITISVVFCAMMYLAGLSYKVIGGVLAVVVPMLLIVFFIITQTDFQLPEPLDDAIGYQLDRIRTWNDPEAEENSSGAIQQNNSITAIGSGQLTGKGLNNNSVSSANKGNFVAEIHNDFIFAVAGEELGFIGCCAIILILSLIVVQCIRIGRRAKDMAGMLIACGVGTLVAFQSFLNISVATGLLPNTGTTLPFVSYGLTSLWTFFMGMGFVLNVGLQNRNFLTRNEELLKKKDVYEHRMHRM